MVHLHLALVYKKFTINSLFLIFSFEAYPRIHVIRATLMWHGFIVVVFPSELISFSSGFNVTNSASIATKSFLTGISAVTNGLNVRSYRFFAICCPK